jgi:hypothetical protein
LNKSETSLQVGSAWSISCVEWSSALRHGVKRDWSRSAGTLVFLKKRGNHLTDTGNIPTNIATVQVQVVLAVNIDPMKLQNEY